MKLYVYSFILIIALFTSCSKNRQQKIDGYIGLDISTDSLQNYLSFKMRELNIPGLSFAMINNRAVGATI